MKMQVYYMENCNQEYSLIAKRKHDLDEKLKPLYTWIINTHLKSKKDCNEYFKKLAADIIAYYSLGDAHNDNVCCSFYCIEYSKKKKKILKSIGHHDLCVC